MQLGSDRVFVPADVGMPSLHEAHAATYGADPELDHPFHEFVCLREPTDAEVVSSPPLMSIERLVRALVQHAGQSRG